MIYDVPMIVIVQPMPLPRLRARYLDPYRVAADAIQASKAKGRPVISAEHGGGVANAYRYPAETEAVLAVAFPYGGAVVYCVRLPANKVTTAGVAAAIDPRYRPLFDGRVGPARRAEARALLLEHACAEYVAAHWREGRGS